MREWMIKAATTFMWESLRAVIKSEWTPERLAAVLAILPVTIVVLSGCSSAGSVSPDGAEMRVPANADEVPRISPEDLKQRIDSGEEILIADVRSVNSYRAQHLPGAISVPLKELEARLDEFPRDRHIVFY